VKQFWREESKRVEGDEERGGREEEEKRRTPLCV
jgi:hypothetical protein